MRHERDSWKQHIARNFDQAVHRYEAQSPVQKKSADDLAGLISASCPNNINKVMEFGCGTGHLTKVLYPLITEADWFITDISPQMVASCMESMPKGPNLTYSVMDAEELHTPQQFDLICSNLTAQWFHNTADTIKKLASHLTPGGHLAFSTLGPNTFTNWRKSFKATGRDPVMPNYPHLEDWQNMLSSDGEVEISTRIYEAEYGSAYDFARALKDIGAHAHSPGQKQLNSGLVRRVLREFDERHDGKPVIADYEVYFVHYRKKA